ncbi:hypothetical protein LBMAG47_22470 [Planctomycetia bacterium]|nr:hypothetical protein LBMAG47_22470 [Planctomycetia bacterium]
MNVTTFAYRWKEFTLPGVGNETFFNTRTWMHVPCRIDRRPPFFASDAANKALPARNAFRAMEETTHRPGVFGPAGDKNRNILQIGRAADISLRISPDCSATDLCGSNASTALAQRTQ